MFKVLRGLLLLAPRRLRISVFRKAVRIPSLVYNPFFKVRVAKTKEDLERAYTLLHSGYVKLGLMDPDPSGLRCNMHSFLPETTTVILEMHGEVLGTLSLIKDSSLGLPSDTEFREQNQKLRLAGKTLVEASSLCVDSRFQGKDHALSFLLSKFLYHYCKKNFASTTVVCTVHPRAAEFYETLWEFKRNGPVKEYSYVKGALAIHLSLELSDDHAEKMKGIFSSVPEDKNPVLFTLKEDGRFIYPERSSGQVLDPVMTPELLRYFLSERTQMISRLMPWEKQQILFMYHSRYGKDQLEFLLTPEEEKQLLSDPHSLRYREYRSPVKIKGVLNVGAHNFLIELCDLSSEGCFVKVDEEDQLFINGKSVRVGFTLDQEFFHIPGKMVWLNDLDKQQTNRLPYGIGIQFLQAQKKIQDKIYSWDLTAQIPNSLQKKRTG